MKKHYFLIIAILIPLVMIVTTAISVLFYQVDLYPGQNFIYIAAEHYGSYQCAHDIKAKLFPEHAASQIPHHSSLKVNSCADTNLYIYDFKNKTNTLITLQQAEKLPLSSNPESSDGFKVEQYCSSSLYFMWPFEMAGNYHYDVCVSKGNYMKKISIPLHEKKYNSFQFIAWIKSS